MPPITVKTHAAIALLAAKLADLLTNSLISRCAERYGLDGLGTNKVARLRSIFEVLQADDRRVNARGELLTVLVMEAHARALAGQCVFPEATLDEILEAARVLSWDVRDLRSKGWRTAIKSAAPAVAPEVVPAAPAISRVRPSRYEEGLAEIARLIEDRSVTPQHRGIQIELVVFEVLRREGLRPQRNVVVPGEQIDLAFDLGPGHYVVECKWLKDPVGDVDISRLTHKIATRPVGVRGVVLSMSGFVRNIDVLVQRGGQQHCIGLDQQHLMSILEGRSSWADLVVRGWREASLHRQFLAPR